MFPNFASRRLSLAYAHGALLRDAETSIDFALIYRARARSKAMQKNYDDHHEGIAFRRSEAALAVHHVAEYGKL